MKKAAAVLAVFLLALMPSAAFAFSYSFVHTPVGLNPVLPIVGTFAYLDYAGECGSAINQTYFYANVSYDGGQSYQGFVYGPVSSDSVSDEVNWNIDLPVGTIVNDVQPQLWLDGEQKCGWGNLDLESPFTVTAPPAPAYDGYFAQGISDLWSIVSSALGSVLLGGFSLYAVYRLLKAIRTKV